MNITLIVIAIILFLVIYASKRRFGLLGLALVAGSIVSASWASYATIMLQVYGIALLSPPLKVVVAGMLVVLPLLPLLIVGPRYHKKWQRVVGSLATALFATAFVAIAIVQQAPEFFGSDTVVSFITKLYALIVVAGVAIAVSDIVFAHLPKKGKNH